MKAVKIPASGGRTRVEACKLLELVRFQWPLWIRRVLVGLRPPAARAQEGQLEARGLRGSHPGGAIRSAASDLPIAALSIVAGGDGADLSGNAVSAAQDAELAGVRVPPAALERSAWARSSASRASTTGVIKAPQRISLWSFLVLQRLQHAQFAPLKATRDRGAEMLERAPPSPALRAAAPAGRSAAESAGSIRPRGRRVPAPPRSAPARGRPGQRT